ncbi:MAG: aminotransferase class I/II-fold pyridoxal phosphate-dependent enzyme [Deltaproteobacteria bacterium]|nr:aminotransferase class I/II-fold pyridoxal phosphate-dependent enzyme [Deltaproteobacteria bacterium]
MIDFRSDTVTKPSPAMLAAMMAAEVGDDVWGEDPTVMALEAAAAARFGKEAGLFCPSGTMTNQIAIRVHTRPGDEVICSVEAHIYNYEGGGIAANSGASVRLLGADDRGRFTAAAVEAAINPDDPHAPHSQLVAVEDTVNRGGGAIWSKAALAEIGEVCRQRGLRYHLDGARVFNRLVATGDDPAEYARPFDSISVCLSKGLGAPVGSVLLGDKAFIHQARRVRKVFGGGMRQAGYLAAAGLYALEHNVARLAEDHAHAARLAGALSGSPLARAVIQPETNIVLFRPAVPGQGAATVGYLKTLGILCGTMSPDLVRFVTHLDVSSAQVDEACALLKVAAPSGQV